MRDLGAYCLTEPGAGSDAAAITTSAIAEGDEYVLTGVKQFISGAGEAGVYVVMARTGAAGARGITAFLVPGDAVGLSFGAEREEDGLERAADATGDPRRGAGAGIRGCSVTSAAASGSRWRGLDGGRVNIAACSLGGAQWALDRAIRYVQERFTFGEPLAEKQSVVFRLADMATELAVPRAPWCGTPPSRSTSTRMMPRCVRHGQAVRDRHRVHRRQ